jgi:hypothetical protein
MLIRQILREGEVTFSLHSLEEMDKDDIERADCLHALQGGVVLSEELMSGTWRYRVFAQRLTVIVAFRSERELRVVTAWRNQK